METITCKECNHVNEAQRVYCHDCGARLDRSALVEEAARPKKVTRSKSSAAVGQTFGYLISNLIKTSFWAALAACIVQSIRPPDGVPKEADLGEMIVDAPSLAIDLQNAAMAPTRLVYGEAALNEYLKNRIKAEKGGFIPPNVCHFELASVKLGQDSLRLTKEYRVFNLPFFIGGIFEPQIAAGGFTPVTLGGQVGRLPIAGWLFHFVDKYVFADFKKGLAEEGKGLDKMKTIKVSPRAVEITSG